MDFVEQDLNALLNIDGSRPSILSRLRSSKSSTTQVATARGGHIDRNVDLTGTDLRGALSARSSPRENNTPLTSNNVASRYDVRGAGTRNHQASGGSANHRQRRILSDQDREEIEEWTTFNKKSRQVMSSISHKIYSGGVGVPTTTTTTATPRDEKQQLQPLDSLENNRCAMSPRILTSSSLSSTSGGGGGGGLSRTNKRSGNAPCSGELIAGGIAIAPIVDESARIRALLVECGGGTTSETVQQGGLAPSFSSSSQMRRPPSLGEGSRSLQLPKIEERHDFNYNHRLGVGITPARSAALWSTQDSTHEESTQQRQQQARGGQGITLTYIPAGERREKDVTMERQVLTLCPPTSSLARGISYQRNRGNEVCLNNLFLTSEEHDYSFRQIPLEVLAHIASFCDARSLVRWGATSKKFYRLQSSTDDFHFLWKDLYLQYKIKSLTSHSGGHHPSGGRGSNASAPRRERASSHPHHRGQHPAGNYSTLYGEEHSDREDGEGSTVTTANSTVTTVKTDRLPTPEALMLLSIPLSSIKSAVIDFIVQHNKEINADLESANERLKRVQARLRYRQEDLRAASQLPPRGTGGGDRGHSNNITSNSNTTMIGAGSFTRALTVSRINARQEVNGSRGDENSAASGWEGIVGNNTNRRDGGGVRVTTIVPHAPAPRDEDRGEEHYRPRGSRQRTFSRGVASLQELGTAATAGSDSRNRCEEYTAHDSSSAPYSNSTVSETLSLPQVIYQQGGGGGRERLRLGGHSRLESIFSDPTLATTLFEEFERLVVKDVVFGGDDSREPESRMSTSSFALSSDAARSADAGGRSRLIALNNNSNIINNNKSVSNFQQLELFFAASQSALSAAAAQHRWACVQRNFYLNDYRTAKGEVVAAASDLVRELLAVRGTRQRSGLQGSAHMYTQFSNDTRRMLAFVAKLTEMNGEELCEYFKVVR